MTNLSFKLSEDFVSKYKDKAVDWGFKDAGGNALGELTFIRTYARVKDDGSKERWWEVCRRVVEGMYSIQKDYVKSNRLPWNDNKAQSSAKEAFDRMFSLKWTPPGRGLWVMGSDFIMNNKNGSALQNCAFLSTGDIDKSDPGDIFAWVMDALMLGIGVGWDTKAKERNIIIHNPLTTESVEHVIDDSREGWVESTRLLINSYLRPNQPVVEFDYSEIRPAGEPIRGFGGTASGPQPLIDMHEKMRSALTKEAGTALGSRTIADLMNLIGTCVVAGNIRRSAELALGQPDDEDFINLKNAEVFPERNSYDPENPGWGWMSNNSLDVKVGQDYSKFVDLITNNGEPGFAWMDVTRDYGRLIDPPDYKDHRAAGFNPCAEQSLESFECCVSGDTRIQTRSGLHRIDDLVGRDCEVWNGQDWSKVTPFYTGHEALYRVTLSDGSYLDATSAHDWSVRAKGLKGFSKVSTVDLKPGMYLPEFSLNPTDGKRNEYAYQWGWFAGDGYVDRNSPMALVQETEYSILNSFVDIVEYKEQTHASGRKFMRISFADVIDSTSAKQLRTGIIPEEVFMWDECSISDFVGGLIDTDGCVEHQTNTDHYVVYGKESILRDVQLLLRRIGVDHSTLRMFSPAGTATNKGTRNYDLFRLTVPSYETPKINTRLKRAERVGSRMANNNAHDGSVIDRARKQKVVSIEKISDSEPTYCFTEPELGMGVFGNVLTYQCTLVEVHTNRADSKEDYLRTLKFAYLYGKTVTLLSTHWDKTNAVMQRNRRIGTSLTGLAGFADTKGLPTLRAWMNDGYSEIQRRDKQYSEWLGVRESIKTTTVKPSGSVSLLSGATPGVHWAPGGKLYLRAIRFSENDAIVPLLLDSGYTVEPDLVSAGTVVAYFPIKTDQRRGEKEVSIFEKINLAAEAQAYWSDNSVSVTVSFDSEKEKEYVDTVIKMYEGRVKTLSFLPMGNEVYPQQPYTSITEEEYDAYVGKIKYFDTTPLYETGIDAEGEKYCANDVCVIPSVRELVESEGSKDLTVSYRD